jgi:cytochrome c oxidase subunit 4
MNALSRIWSSIFYHRSNGWFNLPRTPAGEPGPKNEGPFGAMMPKSRSWFDRVTYGGKHATPAFYVMVAVILTAITLVEVWLFTVTSLGALFVPVLLILSAAKFVMVVGFFMHLRFDPKGFTYVFGAGMALGIAVFVALLSLFFKLNG